MQIGPRQQELLGFWVHFSYFGVKPALLSAKTQREDSGAPRRPLTGL